MTKQPRQFRHLRAWCVMMGSYPYYVADQIKRARESGAPEDAIYERYDAKGATGVWVTFAEVTNENTRQVIETILTRLDREA